MVIHDEISVFIDLDHADHQASFPIAVVTRTA